MSHFGDLVRKLRYEQGLTLEAVAKKIGSHKGYVSGIEAGKVNPPSVKFITKFARAFGQDARALVRLAWVDKAPAILKQDAEDFLRWCEARHRPESGPRSVASEASPAPDLP
ncbi:MAG TPA: helix-turn-helix transcriptional regulator, partial [Planctomycetota bacterium]|nr:helix-turn-helix transcriptional regulator [Planctomycetota bacterium]